MTVLHSVGLCAICQHHRVIKSAKGSTFYMCERAKTDRRFPKYPPLPVVICPGFEKSAKGDDKEASPDRAD